MSEKRTVKWEESARMVVWSAARGLPTAQKTELWESVRHMLVSLRAEAYEVGYKDGENSSLADLTCLLDEDEKAAAEKFRTAERAALAEKVRGMKRTNENQMSEDHAYDEALSDVLALLHDRPSEDKQENI